MTKEKKSNSKPVLNSEQVLKNIPSTLIVGYGNPDREDDGVAWYVLQGIAKHFNIPISTDTDIGIYPEGTTLDFWFNLQLMPEMASEMVNYQRICFVDAHTGAVEEEIHVEKIISRFQNSPLTHHMTPETIVSIMEHLYNHKPETLFVSIRGYHFRFIRSLSGETNALQKKAIKEIIKWILLAQSDD